MKSLHLYQHPIIVNNNFHLERVQVDSSLLALYFLLFQWLLQLRQLFVELIQIQLNRFLIENRDFLWNFTKKQILKTFEQLEEANEIEQLGRFLFSLPPPLQIKIGMTEPVLRAKALICYHSVGFLIYKLINLKKYFLD